MTDIVLNMFFFVSKIVGNTNIIPLQIVILLTSSICIFITGYLLKGLGRTSNEKIYLLKGLSPLIFISFFFILVFTVIPLPYMNDYPSNIIYKIKETRYKEVEPEHYSIREIKKSGKLDKPIDSLSERAVNNYVATIKYGLHKENIDVVKVNKKYNKHDNVKDIDKKYLTPKLNSIKIMPVTVTTNWHGIKETYKRYQVEETYDYEIDYDKVSSDRDKEKLENILN